MNDDKHLDQVRSTLPGMGGECGFNDFRVAGSSSLIKLFLHLMRPDGIGAFD